MIFAIPKSINKDFVILDRNWAHHAVKFKRALFKHANVLVVDACAFRKDQQWIRVWVFNVLFQPATKETCLSRPFLNEVGNYFQEGIP